MIGMRICFNANRAYQLLNRQYCECISRHQYVVGGKCRHLVHLFSSKMVLKEPTVQELPSSGS